jgi:hypothetical protein
MRDRNQGYWLVVVLCIAAGLAGAGCGASTASPDGQPAGGSGGGGVASGSGGASGGSGVLSGAAGGAGFGGAVSTGGATGGAAGTGGSGIGSTGDATGSTGGAAGSAGATGGAAGSTASGAGSGGAAGSKGGASGTGGSGVGGAGGGGVGGGCKLPATVGFQKDVLPFLSATCGGGTGCHVIDSASTTANGGYDHGYDWITAGAHPSSCPETPTPKRFQVVMAVIAGADPSSCSKSRQMPPQNETGASLRTPLTSCQLATLQAWLDGPLVTQAHRVDDTDPTGTAPFPMPPFN